MTDITIRAATAADAPMLAEAEALLFSDAWSERSLAQTLASPFTAAFVAVCDGAAVGYLLASLLAPEGELLRIGVYPTHRKRGIGGRLTEAFLSEAAARGCDTLFLEVRADNAQAISLYRRFGFSEYGLRERYYHDPVADALLMHRDGFKE